MDVTNPKHQKWLTKASPVLVEGEEILDMTTGMVKVRQMGSETERNGSVLVTDRQVILFTTKIGGYDVQDFAYGLLTSVDHKKGLVFGNLNLAAAGDASHVSMIPKTDIERVAQTIRARMALAHQPNTGIPTQPVEADLSEQIRKLAALRDEGLLTEDEFAAKKKQLLGL